MPANAVLRSNSNVVVAIRQPSPSSPTTSVIGTRTSSKNTSLSSAPPSIVGSGRTSTPGACMSASTKVSPPCLLDPSVRTSISVRSAYCACVDHRFSPVMTR